MKLILENVRCFDGRQVIPLSPFTILTGENSSGKSTFLAMLSAVCNPVQFPFQANFNEPPFELGSFNTISTVKGGKYGQAKSFSIGYMESIQESKVEKEVVATYVGKSGQPIISKLDVKSNIGGMGLIMQWGEKVKVSGEVTLRGLQDLPEMQFTLDREVNETDLLNPWVLIAPSIIAKMGGEHREQFDTILNPLYQMIGSLSPRKSVSVAPIRTKPKRTYDQVTDTFNPEGGHIPYVLARMFFEESYQRQKAVMEDSLKEFGHESGLFTKIDVKLLGSKLSDPFQVRATIVRRPISLLDVGYGVSQALPVVVESVRTSPNDLILLQQPEVHLHPKAQAALGTFFASLVSKGKKHLVVETHSDFIVDRVRREIAKGNIRNDLVSILFFSKREYETNVHPLVLDDKGNITNAPTCYRDFFLREELGLLNRAARE